MHAMEEEMFKRKDVLVRKSVIRLGVNVPHYLGMYPTILACTSTDPADIFPPTARKACSERSKALEESMETKRMCLPVIVLLIFQIAPQWVESKEVLKAPPIKGKKGISINSGYFLWRFEHATSSSDSVGVSYMGLYTALYAGITGPGPTRLCCPFGADDLGEIES